MNLTDRSERFWQKTIPVINNIWKIFTDSRSKFSFHCKTLKGREHGCFKMPFSIFYKHNFIYYCIVFIWFYLLYATSPILVLFVIAFYVLILNDLSVFLIIFNFMANFQKHLFTKFVLGEMTVVVSSYITWHVEPKEYILHFKNVVSYSFEYRYPESLD